MCLRNTLNKGDDDDDDDDNDDDENNSNIFNCKWAVTRWQWKSDTLP